MSLHNCKHINCIAILCVGKDSLLVYIIVVVEKESNKMRKEDLKGNAEGGKRIVEKEEKGNEVDDGYHMTDLVLRNVLLYAFDDSKIPIFGILTLQTRIYMN